MWEEAKGIWGPGGRELGGVKKLRGTSPSPAGSRGQRRREGTWQAPAAQGTAAPGFSPPVCVKCVKLAES